PSEASKKSSEFRSDGLFFVNKSVAVHSPSFNSKSSPSPAQTPKTRSPAAFATLRIDRVKCPDLDNTRIRPGGGSCRSAATGFGGISPALGLRHAVVNQLKTKIDISSC